MRKIVAGLHLTLDGVAEAPEEWSFDYFSPEAMQEIQSRMAAADAMLMGRKTYEAFAAFWPQQDGSTDPIAGFMNNTQKYVISSKLGNVDAWQNTTLLGSDLVAEVTKLKEQDGKTIAVSGALSVVRSLLAAGLLDELNVMVCPVVRGKGAKLFPDGTDEVKLDLVESKTLPNGVLSLSYRPAK